MSPEIFSQEVPDLLTTHFEALRDGSGIADEVIREGGYRSVLGSADLKVLGFSPAQRRVPGLLLPICPPDGSNGLYAYRPDNPRVNRDGAARKYELPVGSSVRLDVPPRCRPGLADPTAPLWLAEGQKKADALASRGLCAAALLGVWGFLGRDGTGSVKLLADFDLIAWRGRTVKIVFDSDVMVKPGVRKALDRLTEHLQRKGATVNAVYLPNGPDGAKVGVDDYLLTHSVEELQVLVEQPRPAPRAAAPTVELLDDAPPTLSRPLALVGGRAFATTWLYVRETRTEVVDKKSGEVVQLAEPDVHTERRLFVVRDDGVVFGDGARPLDELGMEVRLADPPPPGKLWRTQGVKAYRDGQRPDVSAVFDRIVVAFDYFLDFARSLGTQRQMCRFSACLSVATWLSDAFTVMGYAWPNGEKGSGKTKWANVWVITSYLGMLLTAGGSFAALRDLAEHGATLVFDDAEGLADPKRSDPDKRALLLAGNRKGVAIPLKEAMRDRWVTRWVPTYSPRGFTAINAPDDVLHSRSIIIPLVKTGDAVRGNRDPGKLNRWPCDVHQLQDDLWALGLWLLPEAEQVWNELDDETETQGRDLEPWRAALTVARLCERHGVEGLETDVREVMCRYFEERNDTIAGDHNRAVALAIVRLVEARVRHASDNSDVSDIADVFSGGWTFSASQIVETLKGLAEDEDDGEAPSWATPKRVGWILSRLRLAKDRQGDRKRTRERRVSLADVQSLASAFRIETCLCDIHPSPRETSAMSETSELSDTGSDAGPAPAPAADDVEVF